MHIPEIIKKVLRPAVNYAVKSGGRSYIAGETLDEAIETGNDLVDRGYRFTLGYWNQYDESPDEIARADIAALQAINDVSGSGYLSIKAPAMKFDEKAYAGILEQAKETGVAIHLDSHSHEDADRTLDMITRLTPADYYSHVSYTLPGRWRRSLQDADRVAELGIAVRVVKGQWADPEEPGRDPRAGFLEVVERLAGKARLVRVASHDPVLAEECIKALRQKGTKCEIELLFGLPVRDALEVARELQVPVRMYIPYGLGSLPYALEYVSKNPRILGWLLKDALGGPYKKRFPRYAFTPAVE